MWSPLDSDFIITGSADSTVRIWKIAYNLPQEKVYKCLPNKTKKKQNKVANTLIENNLTELTKATSECSLLDVCQIEQSIIIVLINMIKNTLL